MAAKKSKPRCTKAQAEANLRRGNEEAARLHGLDRELARLEEYHAEPARQIIQGTVDVLAEMQPVTFLPERERRAPDTRLDLVASANSFLVQYAKLREHIARQEPNQAILTALQVGQAIGRIQLSFWLQHVLDANKRKRDPVLWNLTRQQNSYDLCARIDANLAKRINKRGNRKQPSNNRLLELACLDEGLKDVASYYRIKRKLKNGESKK